MSAEPTMPIRVTRRFSASPERVFDAWLDPGTAGTWLFATPDGVVVRCDIVARVGGRFVITERREEGDAEHVGEYLEIDRPRRLVFSISVPLYRTDSGVVTVEVEPIDGDGCEVALSHTPACRDRRAVRVRMDHALGAARHRPGRRRLAPRRPRRRGGPGRERPGPAADWSVLATG